MRVPYRTFVRLRAPSAVRPNYLLCGATSPQGKYINKSEFSGSGRTAGSSRDNTINIYANICAAESC